jgi:hypothetical protein
MNTMETIEKTDEPAKRKRRSPLHEEAMRLGLEMMERQKTRPPAHFSMSPYRPSAEALARAREEAERDAALETEDRRAYYKEKYAREKALKLGLPAPPPPLTPAARRRERANAVERERNERLMALARERRDAKRLQGKARA